MRDTKDCLRFARQEHLRSGCAFCHPLELREIAPSESFCQHSDTVNSVRDRGVTNRDGKAGASFKPHWRHFGRAFAASVANATPQNKIVKSAPAKVLRHLI